MRSSAEIIIRSKVILDDSMIVSIVENSNSPSAAYDMVLGEFQDDQKAKAARWLAVLKRDHPEEYGKLHINSSHVTEDTARQDKE